MRTLSYIVSTVLSIFVQKYIEFGKGKGNGKNCFSLTSTPKLSRHQLIPKEGRG